MALGYSAAIRSARMDVVAAAAGSLALLRLYDGARPATGGAATTLLAELVCNITFAPSASGGVLTLNPITQDSSANAGGTATWFRLVAADGPTHIVDGNVGVTGSDMNLTTTTIVITQPVAVSSFVITEGNP